MPVVIKSVSKKQQQANQNNAKKSTGPRTAAGKSISRMNATKHGINSREALLPWESEEDFEALRKGLFDDYSPEGALQCVMVDELVHDFWRLQRVKRAESSMFSMAYYQTEFKHAQQAVTDEEYRIRGIDQPLEPVPNSKTLEPRRAIERTKKIQLELHRGMDAELFLDDLRFASALVLLMRYETMVRGWLFRTMDRLQRLQQTNVDDDKSGSIVKP